MTRRNVLQLGLSTAALLTMPPLRWLAKADPLNPHFLVMLMADGGWDPTQTLDVHDPLDTTDGIDVDVDPLISGLPVSQIATVGGITYMSNPTTRPAVDTFFATWASRSAVINGIGTRSTSHDQSRQLVLTGYLDPTRADFAVMAAAKNGPDMPLPHLLLSGQSFGGQFAGLSGRLGGQMGTAIAYNRVGTSGALAVSALGEAYVQQALEWERLHAEAAPSSAVSGKLEAYRDANVRADKLTRLAGALNLNQNTGQQLATSLGNAFMSGLTTAVTVNPFGGFDTHSDNTQQNQSWQRVFSYVDGLVTGLSTQPGLLAPSLLDETTIVVCSEFGRTPELNTDNGKDHHPWTSMLLVGKGVKGGTTLGMTDSTQEGVKVNFSTGAPDNGGLVLDVTNMVAGLVTLMGANSSDYLPTVTPFTAMIA
ncbi:MAG: DUF1501 domain-containing protein [Candidatus Binatia bacterium]